MLTSLSPPPGDERGKANAEVHGEGSEMNCEQVVAYYPEQWKANTVTKGDDVRRHERSAKRIYACPVAAISAQVQNTLRDIIASYSGGRLLAPKLVDGEPTEHQKDLGFLKFQKQ